MLFKGHDFKRFAKACRAVSPRVKAKLVRMLYSSCVYPELNWYLKIEEEYRNGTI